MKLEVGKTYLTRNEKVKVLIVNEIDCENFLGSNGLIYRSSGNFTDRDPTWNNDLVKEIIGNE